MRVPKSLMPNLRRGVLSYHRTREILGGVQPIQAVFNYVTNEHFPRYPFLKETKVRVKFEDNIIFKS